MVRSKDASWRLGQPLTNALIAFLLVWCFVALLYYSHPIVRETLEVLVFSTELAAQGGRIVAPDV